MPLNDRQIKNTKPAAKVCKLSDGDGLAWLIHPNGSKYWQLNFRFNGKQKTLSIGTYPAISLSETRAARETAKQQLANGIDPAAFKQQEKANKAAKLINTFQNLAAQLHQAKLNKWKPNHAARIWQTLENDVLPSIGQIPIDEIAVRDIKAILDTITARGASSTAEKVREWIAAIFRYAAVLELTDRNPAAVLAGHITQPETQHMAALPREQLTAFYRTLNNSNTKRQNKIAILLLMLVFIRSNELRGAQWHEIDFDAGIWTIPAQRMKHEKTAPKPPHKIPLADWTLELLRELHDITGATGLLFPSKNSQSKRGYISENTLAKIMHGIGFKGIATPHGFRSLASSVLNEQGFNPDAIERQLAHVQSDAIRAAYNRAEYWQERAVLMQWYSDFLKQHYTAAF